MAQYKILVKDDNTFKLKIEVGKETVGTIDYKDGHHYAGQIKDDKPVGFGVYTFKDRNTCKGFFKEDGTGIGIYDNWTKYIGDLKDFLPNGFTVFSTQDHIYSGKIENDGKTFIGKKVSQVGTDDYIGKFTRKNMSDRLQLNMDGLYTTGTWTKGPYSYKGEFKDDTFQKENGIEFYEKTPAVYEKINNEKPNNENISKGKEINERVDKAIKNSIDFSRIALENQKNATNQSERAQTYAKEATQIAKEVDKQQATAEKEQKEKDAFEAEKAKATPKDVDFNNVGTVILDNYGAKYEGTLNKDGKPYGYGTITYSDRSVQRTFQGSFVDANNMFGRFSGKTQIEGFFVEKSVTNETIRAYFPKTFKTFSSIPKADVDAFVKLAVEATNKVRSGVVIHQATEYEKIIKENKETGSTTSAFVFGKKVGDGEYYTGQTNSKGDPHGLGSIMHKYTGRFVHGKFDGLGKKTSDDESFYGVFKNGKLTGIGLYWKNIPLNPDKYIFSTGFDGKNYPEVDQNGGLLNYLKEKVPCEINNKKETKERLMCDVEKFVKEINKLKQDKAKIEYERIFDNTQIPEKVSGDLSIIGDNEGNLYKGGIDNNNKYHGFGKLTIKSSIEGYRGNCHVFTGYFKNGSIVVGKYESSACKENKTPPAGIKNSENSLSKIMQHGNALVTATNQVQIVGLKQRLFEQKNITKYIGFFENFKPYGMGKMCTVEQSYGFVSNSFGSGGVKIDEYSYGTSPSLIKVIEKQIVKDIEEKVIKKAEAAVNQVNTKVSSESKTADVQIKENTDLANNENPNKKYVVTSILPDGTAVGYSTNGNTINGTAIITLDGNNTLGLPKGTEFTAYVLPNGTYAGAAEALLPKSDEKHYYFFINGKDILSSQALVTTTSQNDIIKKKVDESLPHALEVLHKNSIMLNEKVLNLDTKKNDIQSVVLNFLKKTNTQIPYSGPGRSYSGQLDQNGNPNGHGTITKEIEKHGRLFGKSTEITTYTGNFVHGVPDGKITINYPDGSKFVGDIRDKTGWGTLTKSTGEIFTGLVDAETGKPGDTGVSVEKDSTIKVKIDGKSEDPSLGPELLKNFGTKSSDTGADETKSPKTGAHETGAHATDISQGWGLKEYGLASAAAALGTAGVYYAYKKYKQSAKPKSKSRRRSKSPEKQSSPKRRTSKKRKRSLRSGSRTSAKRSSASE